MISNLKCSITPTLDSLVQKFWEVEELLFPSSHSKEDQICEEYFLSTHTRLSTSRYVVRLPVKQSSTLGSFHVASKSLEHLELHLAREPKLTAANQDFPYEYESLGHMAPLNAQTHNSNSVYYLPHHLVLKESSYTPLRVIFNASCTTSNGASLNDCLMTDLKLQADLSIILRWRAYRLDFTIDIAKMFRQILIHPDDTDYQRILWRTAPDQPVNHYRLLTVTYGISSSPYLAMRVLQQLIAGEESHYPLASSILRNSIYVDDILFGADYIPTIQAMREQLISLLRCGGFQ
ncbi:PREDICTED: uncharacterized protein LOC106742988 [Dinoponera quadriceps]|uniref:Uncharacterized protein LOC106742988 n=1 Tax=Dinoponera quadriceps TaxID=609295 RepID=A0A6P3X1Z7_DINQU|nr:PREDICTED: uncharacterized protein LOC106742988 [Dinoponera quadriceps]